MHLFAEFFVYFLRETTGATKALRILLVKRYTKNGAAANTALSFMSPISPDGRAQSNKKASSISSHRLFNEGLIITIVI